jgi:Lrp/AsnC family transcriptional regulator, regulator for asnA, asnC and gidA
VAENGATIDELDFDILKLLQEDGRMSYADIARVLGVSLGTVRNRITKLIEDQTLRVIGRIDPYRIGFLSPAEVHVSIEPAVSIDQVAAGLAGFPEVSYLAMMTGDFDLEMDVMCRDRNHLTDLINRVRSIPGVRDTKTRIILSIYKMAQADISLVDPRRQRA